MLPLVLDLVDDRLSPEAKFVLVRLWMRFGQGVVSEKEVALSHELGIAPATFRKSRQVLVESGYIELLGKTEGQHRGRPTVAFRVLRECIESAKWTQRPKGFLAYHHDTIKNVILSNFLLDGNQIKPSPGYLNRSAGRPSLGLSTRLLIAILFSCADECGVISNVGRTMIAKLACMTLRSLDNQLAFLTKIGVILYKVPGLSESLILGRVNGSYFLNVIDSLFENERKSALLLIKRSIENRGDDWSWGEALYKSCFLKGGRDPFGWWQLNKTNQNTLLSVEGLKELKKQVENLTCQDQDQRILNQALKGIHLAKGSLWGYTGLGYRNPWVERYSVMRFQDLLGKTPRKVFLYLEHIIDKVASQILTRHWDYIGVSTIPSSSDYVSGILKSLRPPTERNELRSDVVFQTAPSECGVGQCDVESPEHSAMSKEQLTDVQELLRVRALSSFLFAASVYRANLVKSAICDAFDDLGISQELLCRGSKIVISLPASRYDLRMAVIVSADVHTFVDKSAVLLSSDPRGVMAKLSYRTVVEMMGKIDVNEFIGGTSFVLCKPTP